MSVDVLRTLTPLVDPASAFQIAQALAAMAMSVAGVLLIEVREQAVTARFVLL